MKLFDNIKRTNSNPALNNENLYNYLNNSDRIDINIVREELENWFKKYLLEEKIEIKQRIKTNEQFDWIGNPFLDKFIPNRNISSKYHLCY